MYKEEPIPAYTIMQEINKLKKDVELLKSSLPSGVITTDTVEENNPYAVTSGGVFNHCKTISDDVTELENKVDNADTTPTEDSSNLITSGGVFNALRGAGLPLYQHDIRLRFTQSDCYGEVTLSLISTSNSSTTNFDDIKALIRKTLKDTTSPATTGIMCNGGVVIDSYDNVNYINQILCVDYFTYSHTIRVTYYSKSPAYSGNERRQVDITGVTVVHHYVSDNLNKEVTL